jgi:hypothetical protein
MFPAMICSFFAAKRFLLDLVIIFCFIKLNGAGIIDLVDGGEAVLINMKDHLIRLVQQKVIQLNLSHPHQLQKIKQRLKQPIYLIPLSSFINL